MSKIGRNDPCPCGSKKKFKKCCGNKAMVTSAEPDKVKAINQNGLNAVLYQLINSIGGKFTIAIDKIAGVSRDCKFLSKVDEVNKTVEIWTDKYVEKPLIETPKLILTERP